MWGSPEMSRLAHLIALLVSATLATLAFVGPCAAAADPFADVAPVSTDTLQSERAGFFTADGLEFGFAATLETTVNGQVALVTTLTLQDNGSVTRDTSVNSNLTTGQGQTVIPVSDAAELSAATGLNLSGVQGTGVVIKSSSGVTAVINNVAANQLQNLVINTANGQMIMQNTTVTITLPAFNPGQFQAGQLLSGLASSLEFARTAAAFVH